MSQIGSVKRILQTAANVSLFHFVDLVCYKTYKFFPHVMHNENSVVYFLLVCF